MSTRRSELLGVRSVVIHVGVFGDGTHGRRKSGPPEAMTPDGSRAASACSPFLWGSNLAAGRLPSSLADRHQATRLIGITMTRSALSVIRYVCSSSSAPAVRHRRTAGAEPFGPRHGFPHDRQIMLITDFRTDKKGRHNRRPTRHFYICPRSASEVISVAVTMT